MLCAMQLSLLNSCLADVCRDIKATCCLRGRILLLLVTTTIVSGCQHSEDLPKIVGSLTDKGVNQDDSVPEESLRATGQRRAARPEDWFEDVTDSSGLVFVHSSGRNANGFTMVETFGSGVALLDYDADGDMDVFCAGGGTVSADLIFAGSPNRLFRNDGKLKFTEVTTGSGLDVPVDYSHGVTVGDINNDSLPDLFISCFGRSRLFLNLGQGRFQDHTQFMEPELNGWSTACCFADVTDDGLPDLYVTGYLQWAPDSKERCTDPKSGLRDVCMPGLFPGAQDRLYAGTGDGHFVDITKTAGLLPDGKGLGVVALDFDGNGHLDFYVANDVIRNHLYLGQGGGVFQESAIVCGVSGNEFGAPEGSMGVDAADVDGDGTPDLFVTNYEFEDNSLYRNTGKGVFYHSTVSMGIAGSCRPYVGFGASFLDADLDGWMDLVVVNGHVTYRNRQSSYAQPSFIFRNDGGTRFEDITADAGPWFSVPHSGRGVAVGDLNNDGAPDLVISEQDGPISVLRNLHSPSHWIGVRLRGVECGHDAIGARVRLVEPKEGNYQFVKGGGSYLSCSDTRLIFPVEGGNSVTIEVRWPNGVFEEFRGFSAGSYHLVEQGMGTLMASPLQQQEVLQ